MATRRGITPMKRECARALRKHPTASEALVWEMVRARRMLGMKWRRQHPIDGYVVDFFCVEQGLVLEIDGDIHLNSQQRQWDADRSAHLRRRGLVVLRIQNDDVDRHDLERILVEFLGKVPPLPRRGRGDRGEGGSPTATPSRG